MIGVKSSRESTELNEREEPKMIGVKSSRESTELNEREERNCFQNSMHKASIECGLAS
jgi:hypothetical protein